jgi:hypothetical protein
MTSTPRCDLRETRAAFRAKTGGVIRLPDTTRIDTYDTARLTRLSPADVGRLFQGNRGPTGRADGALITVGKRALAFRASLGVVIVPRSQVEKP